MKTETPQTENVPADVNDIGNIHILERELEQAERYMDAALKNNAMAM